MERSCLAGEWLEKLQRYTRASELVIRPNPKKASEPEVAVQAEGGRILKALSPQVHHLEPSQWTSTSSVPQSGV